MKILYLSNTRPDSSLNSVCIKGLMENGVKVLVHHAETKRIWGLARAVSFYRQEAKNTDVVIIGHDSPVLAIVLRPFCRKKIVYNAVLSVYERMIISRELAPPFSLKAIYYWLIDFLAVHCADLIIVESNRQADFFKKLFRVSRGKVCKNWIGVNEDKFFYDSTVQKFNVFTVLFRGALMPEAGVEYAIRAAKVLENKNIKFIIMGGGILLEKTKKLVEELKSANLELVTDFIPQEKLREAMQKCHLSLGQLSDHNRLARTIPHKAYESLAMKLPYLTASNSGILELLTPNRTCLTCNPADTQSLAEKILWAKNNYSMVKKIAENGYQLYQDKLRPHILAKNLLDRIKTF